MQYLDSALALVIALAIVAVAFGVRR